MAQQRALGRYFGSAVGTVQRGTGRRHRTTAGVIAGAHLNGDRPLRRRRRHHRRVNRHMIDIEPEAPQPGHGQNDGVIAALGKGREARVHIAAKKLDPQVGPALQQDRLAADRGGADNRAMRQRIKAFIAADQRVAPVLARQDRDDLGALGKDGFHILHRMDGGIALAVEKTALKLLDKQALAAGIGKRAVKDAVAARGHAPDFGVQWSQPVADNLGLRHRQRRGAAGQHKRGVCKDVGRCRHSAKF